VVPESCCADIWISSAVCMADVLPVLIHRVG
jgi:hypothetical protein